MTLPDPSMPANQDRPVSEYDVEHALERWGDIKDRGHPLGPERSDL